MILSFNRIGNALIHLKCAGNLPLLRLLVISPHRKLSSISMPLSSHWVVIATPSKVDASQVPIIPIAINIVGW